MQKLVDSRAKGSQVEFAKLIKRSPSVVWQYLKGPKENMGEDMARHIEASLRLKRGWMDGNEDDETLEIDTKTAPSQQVRAEFERLALMAEAGEISWEAALAAMRGATAVASALAEARPPVEE